MKHSDNSASSQKRSLTLGDLQKADVLLARGHGLISDWISKADGGSYSHGALWSGTGVIQATSEGITDAPLVGAFDVYRHRTLDSAGADQVVAYAKTQVDGKYAYTELVMLGLLFSCGLRVKGAILNRLLEAIGSEPAADLNEWLMAHSNRKVRVCTELVATSFYKPADQRFALKILPFSQRPDAIVTGAAPLELPPLVAEGDEPEQTRSLTATEGARDALLAESEPWLRLLMKSGLFEEQAVRGATLALPLLGDETPTNTRKIFTQPIAFDASSGEKLGVVTPADLQFSPSLRYVGHIESPKLAAKA
jgi:hypothetical protein